MNWIERGWNPCGMQFVFISEYVYLFVCVVSIVLFTNIFMQILMINFHQEGSINFINVYLRFIYFNKDMIYLTHLFNHVILFLLSWYTQKIWPEQGGIQEDKVIWKEIEEVIWLFYPKQEDIRSKRRSKCLKMGSKQESIYFIDVLLLCVYISVWV